MIAPEVTRRAPSWLLVVVIASLVPWSCLVNLWFARQRLYQPLERATGGLLHSTLQAALPAVVLYLLLFRLGGLRPRHVGWHARQLPAGIAATLLLWLLFTLLALVAPTGMTPAAGTPEPHFGSLLGQLFGTALGEETVFRGFCLVQFLLLLQARGVMARRSAWLAALLSAVVFALPHIPNRIHLDRYHDAVDVLADQGKLLASGVLMAWVYLRTRNLWWAVGIHSLANQPMLPCDWRWPFPTNATIAALGALLTLPWPRRQDPPGAPPG